MGQTQEADGVLLRPLCRLGGLCWPFGAAEMCGVVTTWGPYETHV